MHSKKIHKTQLGQSQSSLSMLVFSKQLQVGIDLVTVFLNTLNDVKLTTLGSKLFQATTTCSLKKFLRTLSRQ